MSGSVLYGNEFVYGYILTYLIRIIHIQGTWSTFYKTKHWMVYVWGGVSGGCNGCNCTLFRFVLHPMYFRYRISPSLLPCLVDLIINDIAPSGILTWLRAGVRLRLCCAAAPRLLIFSSLNGTSSVRLKLRCTAAPRLLIFSSLDGSSSVRLKLCCTQARNRAGALGAIHKFINHLSNKEPQGPVQGCSCTQYTLHIHFLTSMIRTHWCYSHGLITHSHYLSFVPFPSPSFVSNEILLTLAHTLIILEQ